MLVRWTIVGLLTLLAPERVSAATVGFRRVESGWVSRSGFAIVGPGFEIAGNNGSLGGFCGFPNSWDGLCVPDKRRNGVWANDLHGTGILDGISFDFYPSPP